MPVTSVDELIPLPVAAIDVVLLLHVPRPEASLNNVVNATHTVVVPVIGAGNGCTVTVVYVGHIPTNE